MLPAVFNHLWQSTIFAAMAGLLTLALRKNPARVRHGLWLAASLKFLIPFALLIAIGGRIEWRTAPAIAPNVSVAVEQVSQPFTLSTVSSPVLATMPTAPNRLPAILFGIWACGFIGISLSWWIRWRRVTAAVRAGSPIQLDLPIRAISSPSFLEPGIFGVFRPILLLPEGITEHLTPEQFRAVVAHELCHVRNRDNLVGAVQMFIEAVFWFHPLVWWIGTLIFQERERACDEEVVRSESDPRTYAQGILRVCELYLASPVACVSGVTGGANLKKRIELILSKKMHLRLNFARKAILCLAAVAAVSAPIAVGILHAQSAETGQFDVASVRPHVFGSGLEGPSCSNGRFVSRGAPLVIIIRWAYDLSQDQFRDMQQRLPSWMFPEGGNASTLAYDIEAKSERRLTESQCKAAVQALLADRFKLAVHWESKEGEVSDLVVARGGPKMQKVTDRDTGRGVTITLNGTPVSSAAGAAAPTGWTMEELAAFLSFLRIHQPVIDKTGLEGRYKFVFRFYNAPPRSDQVYEDPDLETALQQQLGLKLETHKGIVKTFLVDHIERPSAN